MTKVGDYVGKLDFCKKSGLSLAAIAHCRTTPEIRSTDWFALPLYLPSVCTIAHFFPDRNAKRGRYAAIMHEVLLADRFLSNPVSGRSGIHNTPSDPQSTTSGKDPAPYSKFISLNERKMRPVISCDVQKNIRGRKGKLVQIGIMP